MKVKKLLILMVVFVTLLACGLSPNGVVRPTPSAPAPAAPAPSDTPLPSATPSFAPAPPPEVFARIPELQGGVKAKQPGDAGFVDAVVGMTLPSLSQVRWRMAAPVSTCPPGRLSASHPTHCSPSRSRIPTR
jgi:hypothetical protein